MKDLDDYYKNEGMIITIGNKPLFYKTPDNKEIRAEPYLRAILTRIGKYPHVYIKTNPDPVKLGHIMELYELLKPMGIRHIRGNVWDLTETKKNDNLLKVRVRVIRWDIIPRLEAYREELRNEIREVK
ncbi:MAG: hypothetical protein AABY22_29835 [Nanoarchaeota archaeon]